MMSRILSSAILTLIVGALFIAMRTAEAQGERAFTPENYGAKGDGVTDDVPAFVAAIAAAGDNSTIYGTHGKTYLFGPAGIAVVKRSNVKLVGRGAKIKLGAMMTQAPAGLGSTAIFIDTGTRITFSEWVIDGNGKASNAVGLKTCNQCEIADNLITSAGSMGQVVSVNGVRNRFLRNTLGAAMGSARAMWLGNVNASQMENDVLIEGNQITSGPATGIVVGAIGGRVMRNQVEGLSAGAGIIVIGGKGLASSRLEIIGNVLKGSPFHGIQSDVVGYKSSSDIPTEITITDNLISNSRGAGIYAVYADRWTIQGNRCVDNGTAGIYVARAKRISISGNTCTDTRSGGSRTQKAGIQVVSDDPNVAVMDIAISGNTLSNNSGYGVLVTTTSTNSVASVSITRNDVSNNGSHGIQVSEATKGQAKGISVVGNTLKNNGAMDLRIDVRDRVIADNLVSPQRGSK